MGYLKLTFSPDESPDDHANGIGRLAIEVALENFTGRVRCWATLDQLQAFGSDLAEYPLVGPKHLTPNPCGISISQITAVGLLAAVVGLETMTENPTQKATLTLLTDYSALDRFAGRLRALTGDKEEHLTLDGRG